MPIRMPKKNSFRPAKILVLLFLFITRTNTGRTQPVTIPLVNHQFVVIAHRGDHTHAPENTLAAFRAAINAGADFVEIDLRTTKDSQLVILHNTSLDEMTGVHGRLSDFTWDSVQQMKVRNPLHPEWGTERVPLFKEVLELCKGKINIYLDFKDASVAAAYDEIKAAGMEKNMVVYINNPLQFIAWRKTAPAMSLMVSLPEKVSSADEMDNLLEGLQTDILDGSYDEYTAETVLAAGKKGVPVWADIQSPNESPTEWDKALALKLAGLQTDHPSALVEYLIKKGSR
jgi:glycerophosphoryl diester phosphodiesterase